LGLSPLTPARRCHWLYSFRKSGPRNFIPGRRVAYIFRISGSSLYIKSQRQNNLSACVCCLWVICLRPKACNPSCCCYCEDIKLLYADLQVRQTSRRPSKQQCSFLRPQNLYQIPPCSVEIPCRSFGQHSYQS